MNHKDIILCIVGTMLFIAALCFEGYVNRYDNAIAEMDEETYWEIHDKLYDVLGRQPSRDEIAEYYIEVNY